jgi:ubiquinone/menaquinone biosynthesis C-methylase UbiE
MGQPTIEESQAIAVKRAQVEFHNFASLGEPERAIDDYAEDNRKRGSLIRSHIAFTGTVSPFLEIGANAGHTSYLLANDFEAGGFALDISADALRHGMFLMDHWGLSRAPVRMAGDALNLPFRDGSLRFVMTFQTLSQFLDMDAVFREAKRVLAPGGVFLFGDEPIKRLLSVRLYRCPYYEKMKPWERWLYDRGLLGFVVKDVIGADQEESFGIRQNHRNGLKDWQRLVERHFPQAEYEIFLPQRGWAERWIADWGRRVDRYGSDWVPARLLGGTLAAFCRKEGAPDARPAPFDRFERYLRCPDCSSDLDRDSDDTLRCAACGYSAANEGGVYNLIRSEERRELYPGDRADLIDFTLPGHAAKLGQGWYDLEGVFGNKYRWIGARATATVTRVKAGRQKLRVRGFAHESAFGRGEPVRVEVALNGQPGGAWTLHRSGLFVLEAPVPDAPAYQVEIKASPLWTAPPDERVFSVNISMIRLVDA